MKSERSFYFVFVYILPYVKIIQSERYKAAAMKRNTSGGVRDGTELRRKITELKPYPLPREDIQGERIVEVAGITLSGDPIYISKSFVAVGQSSAVASLPADTVPGSLSAETDILVALGASGMRLYIYKIYNFGARVITNYVDLGLPAVKTTILMENGQRTVIVGGPGMIATIAVPIKPFSEDKCIESKATGGAILHFVQDASAKCCHVVFDSGEWYQVLSDGQIVERLPLPMTEMGKFARLLAADVMRGIFLFLKNSQLCLSHGAVDFPLGLVANPDDNICALWGGSGMLYIQIGTVDLVPALTALHVHTGAVLDTLFPTGVATGTLREYQTAKANAKTIAYNNGIYILTEDLADTT